MPAKKDCQLASNPCGTNCLTYKLQQPKREKDNPCKRTNGIKAGLVTLVYKKTAQCQCDQRELHHREGEFFLKTSEQRRKKGMALKDATIRKTHQRRMVPISFDLSQDR
jgi:hypothetical protein